MFKSIRISVAIFIVALLSSWGFLAHKTLTQLAIYKLPGQLSSFFYENKAYLVYNAVRPDVRRRDDKTEDTKHYVDIDAPAFGPNALEEMPESWPEAVAKYSEDTLRKYGTVCWEIVKIQQQLTKAFKNQNKDSVLFYAADLSHYIADAHVPLHTTINYDGQLTDQIGMHALWETIVPEVHIDQYNLYNKRKAKYIKDPQKAIWAAFRQSYAMLNEVLETERSVAADFPNTSKYKITERDGKKRYNYTGDFAKAYHKVLGQRINQRLLASSDMVADFWFTAWKDAGCPKFDKLDSKLSEQFKNEKSLWKSNELVKQNKLDALIKK